MLWAAPAPTLAGSGPRAHAAQSKGEVLRLQRALGVAADGVFGPQTERAVKRLQRRHGMSVDGIVGPATRRVLGLGAGPVLKRERRVRRASRRSSSHRGGGVRTLQRALGLPADGVFGPQTEMARRLVSSWTVELAYQTLERYRTVCVRAGHAELADRLADLCARMRSDFNRHLVADGVVGPATRRALGLGSGPMLKRRSGAGGEGGGDESSLERVIAAANRIASKPYRYGGGHQRWRDSGYDCSGSISYALHGGGLLASQLDSTGFMSYGLPGRGRHITIYANPAHAYMVVDGRRFDTSAIRETGSRWTSTHRSQKGYTVRHPLGL